MPLLYLDPGTGSLLLYAIVGITTTVLFALRGFWYSMRSKLFLGKKGAVKEMPGLVFQSEGGKYWQVFQPVLKALDKYDVRCEDGHSDEEHPSPQGQVRNLACQQHSHVTDGSRPLRKGQRPVFPQGNRGLRSRPVLSRHPRHLRRCNHRHRDSTLIGGDT